MSVDKEVTAFPLCWPTSRPRTKLRKCAVFHQVSKSTYRGMDDRLYTREQRGKPSIDQARQRVSDELRRLGAKRAIISSNLELRNDGLPRSGQGQPADPGIAVYFDLDGGQKCIAIDLWDRVEDNLVAIAKSIDAMRGLERWGGAQIVAAVFTGFKALPGGDAIVTPMTVEQAAQFLSIHGQDEGSHPTVAQVIQYAETFRFCFRVAAKAFHPDRNGGIPHPNWVTLQQAVEVLEKHHGK